MRCAKVLSKSVLALALFSDGAFAATPKAVIQAPATIPVGQLFMIGVVGTVSDSEPALVVAQPAPAPLLLSPSYDRDRNLQSVLAQPTVPGDYTFVLVAAGTPATPTPSGKTSGPAIDVACYTVHVTGSPTPPPGPGPNPGPAPAPTPSNAGEKLGQDYVPVLAESNAASWDAYAKALESGAKMSDAQKVFRTQWADVTARKTWLENNLTPIVTQILPVGSEPTPEQRKALVDLARSIAKGERGAK